MEESQVVRLRDVIKNILLRRIAQGRLELPALPSVAGELRKALESGAVRIPALVGIVERDPMLTALVLRSASTAAMGGQPATGLRDALTRLGEVRLMAVVVEAMARQVFVSEDAQIRKHFCSLLRHSLAVALVARDIARQLNRSVQDTVYAAGLLHDVGKVVVANTLLRAEHELHATLPANWRQSWLEVVDGVHRQVAERLAADWRLPSPILAVLRHDDEYEVEEPQGAVNIVLYANALTKAHGLGAGSGGDDDAVAATLMMGSALLELEDDVAEDLVADLGERVDSILCVPDRSPSDPRERVSA